MVSAADYFVGYVFFLHRITLLAAGDGLLPVRLPAGNILSILLILSKNPGESMRCVNDTCGNCLPTQNSEEPKKPSPGVFEPEGQDAEKEEA